MRIGETLSPWEPILLKLYLNYSLFVFEVMEDAERAIDMASVAVFEAVEEMKA